jgi:phosphotransferase system  glucose/maltose/N-acetylglucosamine-specific IIC component
MRKLLVLFAFLVLIGCTALTVAAPVQGIITAKSRIPLLSYSGWSDSVAFKGGERAVVVVDGNHQTYMGVYIFDEEGNCIAHDDLGNQRRPDDLEVEWVPPRTGRYRVEVRNFGSRPNVFELALR